MKKYLVTGLLIWVPLAITLWVLSAIVGTMDKTLLLLPQAWQPEQLFGFPVPGLGVLLTGGVVLLTGLVAANFIGQRLVKFWDGILSRIPFFNTIYGSVKQVSDTLLSSSGNAFRQAVLVPYPQANTHAVGFLTGEAPVQLAAHLSEPHVTVFIPTAPNPTAGFVVLVPSSQVKSLDLTVDEALKYVVSMGVVAPPASNPSKSKQ